MVHVEVIAGPEMRTVCEAGESANPVGVQSYTKRVEARVALRLETESATTMLKL